METPPNRTGTPAALMTTWAVGAAFQQNNACCNTVLMRRVPSAGVPQGRHDGGEVGGTQGRPLLRRHQQVRLNINPIPIPNPIF